MIKNWLNIKKVKYNGRKVLYMLDEKNNGRIAAQADIINCIRTHYQAPQLTDDDIEELGFLGAAKILREILPRSDRARSGDVGEILAVEFTEQQTDFRVPIRRLRYKDRRDMSMRGDDFIGIKEAKNDLHFLKGEAKSRQNMTKNAITEARTKLNANNGLPTTESLLFIANRLIENNETGKKLGRRIRNAVGNGIIRSQHVTHSLFTLTGNDPQVNLKADIRAANKKFAHISINLRINDHQEFIAWIYEEAENFGNG